MKKAVTLILALAMCISLASCGGNSSSTTKTTTKSAETTTMQSQTTQSETVATTTADDKFVLGELVKVDENSDFVIRYSILRGNKHNEEEQIDGASTFELNEHIAFYITSNANELSASPKLYIVKHSTEHKGNYADGEYAVCENLADHNLTNGEFSCYLNPDSNKAGLYDIVYTYNDKVVAYQVIELTPEK